jgi:ADP-heptose:LPS heptosyltransferase
MAMLRSLERKGKRLLVRITTAVVKTPRMSRDEVLSPPPRRILVVRQHHQMGDMLLAVPAFRAIKQTFPQAEVTVLTGRINRDVLVNNPYVDHLLTYNIRSPLGAVPLVRAMRHSHFDLAIVLHTVSFSFTSAILGLLSGARVRCGSTSQPFGNRMSEAFYHFELPLPSAEELDGMNEAEHNLYPLAALGIHTDDIAPLVVPYADGRAWAEGLIATHGSSGTLNLVVHPGAGKVENIWPPENFADVVERLAANARLAVYVVEGPRDAEPVERFRRLIRSPSTVVRRRMIGDIAALMQASDLVLCNDTGVMHVASAAGARTLAVFGPTDPVRWAPRCRNLHIVRAPGGDLRALDPAVVFEEALGLLAESGRLSREG